MYEPSVSHKDVEQTPSPRTWLRVGGACLWVLVFVCLYFTWQVSQRRTEGPAKSANGAAEPSGPKPEPLVLEPDDVDQGPREVADFRLTERSGRTVTKADLLGRPWVAAFVFTRCAGPCPRIMGQFAILQEELKESDARLVTFTVDPEYDTPEVLKQFAHAFNADPERWWFLTGGRGEIYDLIENSFRLPVGEDQGEIFHSNRVVHVDADGRIVKTYLFPEEAQRVALKRAVLGRHDEAGAAAVAPKPEAG
jgi:protein SCO1/2/putative membrane protein